MISLPNFASAIIPTTEKLRDYALNPDHPEGKHKAKVFRDVLAVERRHAETLATIIRATFSRAPAERDGEDVHGVRWTTYHEITGLNGKPAIVTVAWIFRSNAKDVPCLISCYIEPDKQDALKERYFAL